MSKHKFETEVNQLLHLIIHSLYSNPEIFLRELISNASDALDKLKQLVLTDEKYKQVPFEPRIDIYFDTDARTLTVSDSGIGMNQADLIDQIGTIARSGTRSFMEQLSGDSKKDSNLIGQFGVGFYSAFMVANFVELTSKKVLEEEAWCWTSNGQGDYQVNPGKHESFGTTVELRLNQEGRQFANRWTIESIIKKYSNHISYPIYLHYEEKRTEGDGDDKKEISEQKQDQVNEAKALWKRPKRELKEEDYNSFYKNLSHDMDDPLLHIHQQAEGTLEYSVLLFVPQKAPHDLFYADYKSGVKLYVKRVFITDDGRELLPAWLRFVRGVIDSEDLPLNVSREILQSNPIMERIRTSAVKKLLDEFDTLAKDEAAYASFWEQFGRPIKEGLFSDYAQRERLSELVRFKSSKLEGLTSLGAYQQRMSDDQKTIYYITGEKERALRESPLLEAYRDRDIEVLIMDDEIDEIVIGSLGKYKDLSFTSINRSDAAEDLKSDEDKKAERDIEPLVKRIKDVLGEQVKDVRASTRLTDSPACIVVDKDDPTIHMQGILKSLGQNVGAPKPILEINPTHTIVDKLSQVQDDTLFNDISHLLLEQAMLLEGVEIENPASFVKRINTVLSRAF